MKATLTFILLIGIGILSCTTISPKDDIELLYQRFHGKYKIVSSTSSEPLDVNFDGVSSTDLLSEMSALSNYGAHLDLRVKYPDRSVFLFSQFWPEQYIYTYTGPNREWNGWDALSYDPAYSVNYANQASPYSFSFTEDMRQILVTPNEKADKIRWVRPESVLIEAEDRLRLTNKRRIYTRTGVKEVTIVTLYERFTMST
ncbi:MAG: hypothetical protein H7Z72_25470 [Bacteroidetes bacterium]|nr:hypothetical protein [Fibrella sp.]